MPEQRGPAAGVRIPLRDHRHRQWPPNRQIRVIIGDGEVLSGIVWTVDPVAHIGGSGQRLEPVQKAGRYVKVPEVVVIQQKRLLFTESWRIFANVHKHIVHSTVGAADQLGLAAPGASVHATNDAGGRTRLRVLDERRRCSRFAQVVVENLGVERPGEEAAIVAERLRDEDENTGQAGLFDTHGTMLP